MVIQENGVRLEFATKRAPAPAGIVQNAQARTATALLTIPRTFVRYRVELIYQRNGGELQAIAAKRTSTSANGEQTYKAEIGPWKSGDKVLYGFRVMGLRFPFPRKAVYESFTISSFKPPKPPTPNPLPPRPEPTKPEAAPSLPLPGASIAALPVLLQPIHIETRFVGDQLWLRFLPDGLFIDRHIPTLTPEERRVLTEYDQYLLREGDAPEQRQTALRQLVQEVGAFRAAYLVRQGAQAGDAETRQQRFRMYTLPSAFQVYLYKNGSVVQQATGAPIPEELEVLGAGSSWEFDFERAIAQGMGIKIDLDEALRSRIDRIVVVGWQQHYSAAECSERIDQLFTHHAYTDGFSFLDYGTLTNNTSQAAAGYSVTERRDAEGAYDWVFSTVNNLPTIHGQRFSKALGLPTATYTRMRNGAAYPSVNEVALQEISWPVLGSYTIESLVPGQLDATTKEDLADHFTEYVRSSGPLPSLRIGRNPYGILPVGNWKASNPNDPKRSVETLRKLLAGLFEEWLVMAGNPDAVPRLGVDNNPESELAQILSMQAHSQEVRFQPILNEVGLKSILPETSSNATSVWQIFQNASLFDSWQQAKDKKRIEAQAIVSGVANLEENAPLFDKFDFGPAVSLEHQLSWPIVPDPLEFTPAFVAKVQAALEEVNYRTTVIIPAGTHSKGSLLETLISRAIDSVAAHTYQDRYRMKDADTEGIGSPTDPQRIHTIAVSLNERVKQGYLLYRAGGLSVSQGIPVRARKAGIVSELFVDEGALVRSGDPILTIDYRDESAYQRLIHSIGGFFGRLSNQSDPATNNDVLRQDLLKVLDLSAYRLDAWITSLITRRLREQRSVLASASGLHYGAYGWVENLERDQQEVQANWVPIAANFDTSDIVDACWINGRVVTVWADGPMRVAKTIEQAFSATAASFSIGYDPISRVVGNGDTLYALGSGVLVSITLETRFDHRIPGRPIKDPPPQAKVIADARGIVDIAFFQRRIYGLKNGNLFVLRNEAIRSYWEPILTEGQISSIAAQGNQLLVLRDGRLYQGAVRRNRLVLDREATTGSLENIVWVNQQVLGKTQGGGWVYFEHFKYEDRYASNGGGFVHAPSVPQAVATGLAKSGFMSHDGTSEGNVMALNLSSDRLQQSEKLHAGIREGQEFRALLGYRFERYLHEVGLNLELMVLRRLYPVVQKEEGGTYPILNVIDGLKILENEDAVVNYFSGSISLPYTDGRTIEWDQRRPKLRASIRKLRDIKDASSDSLLFEALYQAAQGNYEQAAAALDATAGRRTPPELESLKTPVAGTSLTHKLLYLFPEPSRSAQSYLLEGNVRAAAQPVLEGWLESQLGPLSQIRCTVDVSYQNPNGANLAVINLNKADLSAVSADYGLHPEFLTEVARIREEMGPLTTLGNPFQLHFLELENTPYVLAEQLELLRSVAFLGATNVPEHQIAYLSEVTIDLSDLAVGYLDLMEWSDSALVDGDSHLEQLLFQQVRNRFRLPSGLQYRLPEQSGGDGKSLGKLLGLLDYHKKLVGQGRPFRPSDWQPAAREADADYRYPFWYQAFVRLELIRDDFEQALEQISAFSNGDVGAFRNGLQRAARFGLMAAQSTVRENPTYKEVVTPLRRKMEQKLAEYAQAIQQCKSALGILGRVPIPQNSVIGREVLVELQNRLEQAGQALLGTSFRLFLPVVIRPKNDPLPETNQSMLLGTLGQERIREWVQGIADVEPAAQQLEDLQFVTAGWRGTGAGDGYQYQLRQFAPPVSDQPNPWVALNQAERQDILGSSSPPSYPRGATSMVMAVPETMPAVGPVVYGMSLLQKSEHIPESEIESGVAFHYDAPNTEPPQSLLLAVADYGQDGWSNDQLASIVNDTLDLAKVRLVDPDALNRLGFFFPATYLPFNIDYAQEPPAPEVLTPSWVPMMVQKMKSLSLANNLPDVKLGTKFVREGWNFSGMGQQLELTDTESGKGLAIPNRGLQIEWEQPSESVYLTIDGANTELAVVGYNARNQSLFERKLKTPGKGSFTFSLPVPGVQKVRISIAKSSPPAVLQRIKRTQ